MIPGKPKPQMLQDLPYGILLLDESNNFHISIAF
jgi:hypothetical protein